MLLIAENAEQEACLRKLPAPHYDWEMHNPLPFGRGLAYAINRQKH